MKKYSVPIFQTQNFIDTYSSIQDNATQAKDYDINQEETFTDFIPKKLRTIKALVIRVN